jgi:hypothetical protein
VAEAQCLTHSARARSLAGNRPATNGFAIGYDGVVRRILYFLQVFSLGAWLGAIILLVVLAPAIFVALPSRDQAGVVIGLVIARLHLLGIILGVVYLIASVAFARSLFAVLKPAVVLVILMVALTFFSQNFVSRRMDQLRIQMGSVDATPLSNPLRMQFDRLHPISVGIEGAVLILGLVALFLTTRPGTFGTYSVSEPRDRAASSSAG